MDDSNSADSPSHHRRHHRRHRSRNALRYLLNLPAQPAPSVATSPESETQAPPPYRHHHRRRHRRHHHRNPEELLGKLSVIFQKPLQDFSNSRAQISGLFGQPSREMGEQANEMHEFVGVSENDNRPVRGMHNPYAPPPSSLVSSSIDSAFSLFQRPMNAINQVSNILGVRPPGDLLYEATSHLPVTISSLIRPPGNAQPVYNYNHINMQHDRPKQSRDDVQQIVHPPPPLPPIEASLPQTRLEPLKLEDVANDQDLWNIDALCVRVFKGGVENNNETRLKLWPYLLGMVNDDDDQVKISTGPDGSIQVDFDWTPYEKLFEHYQQQYRSILPDQEKRFTLYREVKSLIHRDVIRCDRTHGFYEGDNNVNLDKLRDLLLTYVMHDFDTGYVQGMSDLASPLLYVTGGDVCKAFWFFVKIMEFTKSNFEMLQTAIKLQHELLWKLVNITDPVFAQYLRECEGMNCYFAFRWFVCQFKREMMKKNDDGYHDVLLLWESIWTCNAMRRCLLHHKLGSSDTLSEGDEIVAIDNDSDTSTTDEHQSSPAIPLIVTGGESIQDNQELTRLEDTISTIKLNETNEKAKEDDNKTGETSSRNAGYYSVRQPKLTDTQLYVLCICLAIIRRERDLILTHHYSNADILKHFNTLELNSDLKNILIHASNIWSWLVLDGNEELLYKEDSVVRDGGDARTSQGGGNAAGTSANEANRNDDDFDLLSDLNSSSPINLHASTTSAASHSDHFIFSST